MKDFFTYCQACLSVFLFLLFSKRSFIRISEATPQHKIKTFLRIAKLAWAFFCLCYFQSGALSGSAELLLKINERLFYVSPSLLERFFVWTIFKTELYQDPKIILSWSQMNSTIPQILSSKILIILVWNKTDKITILSIFLRLLCAQNYFYHN